MDQQDSHDQSSNSSPLGRMPSSGNLYQTQSSSHQAQGQDGNESAQQHDLMTTSLIEHVQDGQELLNMALADPEPIEKRDEKQIGNQERDRWSQDDKAMALKPSLPIEILPGQASILAGESLGSDAVHHTIILEDSHTTTGLESGEQSPYEDLEPRLRDDTLPMMHPQEHPREETPEAQESDDEREDDDESSQEQEDDSDSSTSYSSLGLTTSPMQDTLDKSLRGTEFFYSSIEAASADSASTKQWLILRDKASAGTRVLDQIMKTFGHEEVKSHCISVFELSQEQDHEASVGTNLIGNALFCGNQGLGVETLSKLYAMLLEKLGYGQLSTIRLRSKVDVEGILKPTHDQTRVFLIDKLSMSPVGLAALKTLFDESGNLRPRVYVIACATWYNADEERVFANEFPKMRQPQNTFLLQDYFPEHLHEMLVLAAQRSGIEFEDGPDSAHLWKAVELISHDRGKPGFRNWIAVRESMRAMTSHEQRRNEQQRAPRLLTKADILGETAANLTERSLEWRALNGMVGLEQVKKTVQLYFSQIQYRHCRVLQSRQTMKLVLNRLFIGPPGTGKTTTARLLAKILGDLGLVSNKKVVIKQPTTLIGPYIGHSERNTRNAVKEAQGGILIIDNAHAFFSGGTHEDSESDCFRSGIIDTLIGQWQQHEGDDASKRVTVFFIGHKDPIIELLETSNAGLGQMLRLDEALHFPAYSDDHLGEILQQELNTADLAISPEAMKTALEILKLAKHRPNFGNATRVKSLLSTAVSRHEARVLSTMDIYQALTEPLQPQDFDPDWNRPLLASQRSTELFSDLEGMDYVSNIFKGYQELVVQLRDRDLDPRPYVPMSFVFKGPPGTGKTTVARKVAQLYYNIGFLSAPDMIECSVSQLVSTSRGSRSGVEVMFERALGKVLFIDEAYLLRHTGGHGAIGSLVDSMTKERFAGKLVVVLAGYTEDMEELLEENRGLRSRFSTNITFQPMKPTNAINLLKKLVEDVDLHITGLELGDPLRQQALRFLTRLNAQKSWANGRDVQALARILIQNTYKTFMKEQLNENGADVAPMTKDAKEVKGTDVVVLLATHLGKAIEAEGKQAALEEQVQGPGGGAGA